uniref:Reverse transcriptase domain-containing protein n=1 Tax=Tanacetum cinerariifolium TaxID=118510 RepID=A0A6L2LLZ2_TANCI|nr:hypothetical protein [Tanacetum cinerariifolium]
MGEVDVDTLTIKQYIMLTQGNQAPCMVKIEFGGMMEKDTENINIAEYMEYEVEMKKQSSRDALSYLPIKYEITEISSFNRNKSRVLGCARHFDDSKINAYYNLPSLLPCFKPVQPHTKDRDGKHMCGQDKENEEDALIAILKSLVGKCKAVYNNKGTQIETYLHETNEVQGVSFVADDKEWDISRALPCQLLPKELNLGSFTLPCSIGSLNLYAMVDLETSVNVMPKLIFKHLKLANLKKLTWRFVATIHAQIDIFKREISLGIGEDIVNFDMDRGVCHSRILVEKIYMANSIHEEEYFNPFEIKDDVFSYESPTCLLFEQCTQSCDNESVDTLNSADNMHELKDIHVDMDYEIWPTCNSNLSFCSGYDVIYEKRIRGRRAMGKWYQKEDYKPLFVKIETFEVKCKEMEFEVSPTRFHVATKWLKRLVSYAKSNHDSYEKGIPVFEQETRDLDMEIMQIKELKANYDVTTPQELLRNQVNEGISQHLSYSVNASSCLRRNQHRQRRMTYPSHLYGITSTQVLRCNTI